MNQIAWLENNIGEVERLLPSHRAWLDQAPDSFSARLICEGTEARLAELQHQLRQEKERRDREVVDLRLTGLSGMSGTISLDLLSKIAKELSKAVHAAAYYSKFGRELLSRVPGKLEQELDLRLAGLEYGSTRLVISSKTLPNLFGYSTTEGALGAIFDIVQADGDQEITNAVALAGVKSSQAVARLCEAIAGEKAAVKMRWDTPSGGDRVFEGGTDRLINLSSALMDLAVIPPENLNVTGTLDLVGVKGQFEVRVGEKTYKGRYQEALFKKVRRIPIGSTVDAKIKKETIENKATGYSKEVFSLVEIHAREISPEKAIE